MPVLSHIEQFKNFNFWITTDKVVGISFSLKPCDLETDDFLSLHKSLTQNLKNLHPSILVRLEKRARTSFKTYKNNPRAESVKTLGHTVKDYFVHMEYRGGLFLLRDLKSLLGKSDSATQFDLLLESAEIFKRSGFDLLPFSEEDIRVQFDQAALSSIRSSYKSVETPTESIGVVRLLAAPAEEFLLTDWVKTLNDLPLPNQVSISFRRIDEAKSKILLERRLKQAECGNDITSSVQYSETEKQVLENFKTGSQLFEMEVLILFRRSNLASFTEESSKIQGPLARFSEFGIETFGVIPSYLATMPGNEQHVTLYESENALGAFMPVWVYGETDPKETTARSLSLFRQDRSLFNFDLFDPNYSAFNTVIVGTTGKGKSVLTGLLTTALLNDPNVCIIKLDVGGSHSKEVELFGGEERILRLDEPSGINPFEVFSIEASASEKIGILSKFLESLICENGEMILTKSIRGEIESEVRKYFESSPQDPDLNGFYLFAQNFPRRDLLRRWVKGGLYEAAFATRVEVPRVQSEQPQSNISICDRQSARIERAQLHYFNFSEMFQASDPEFAQAGIAAVLAHFNMEVLRASGKRLVLICDETPFFIKSCFDFFKFTTANVRKYGHAVVLVSQLSSDLVVNGDAGILENSPQRFLFSMDGDVGAYKERLHLRDKDIQTLKSLKALSGQFSECLFQTENESRKLKIEVTREEYWRLTTSKVDKDKLISLMANVKGLSLSEAIRCLSMADL